ncbi:DUF1605-domain-containing protein [Pseudohyphozyma bogoriensis]|nr:DUF1605-domain-containing protein [Pseudohyphozyma bogoriensis]
MAFWKPGTIAPGSAIDRDSEATSGGGAGGSVGAVTGRVLGNIAASERRSRLPIAKQRDALLYLLEEHPVVILQSPTGTGKSTQLPQFLLEAGWAQDGRTIGVTQPRRVAAISVAQRVAEEVGCVLGEEVGYNIRFESLSTPETKILYLTDGMLFREILLDPVLSRYSVIMVDEAHERSIYTDLLLGVLKKIRRVRPSLRIIISSATIDADSFVDFFNYAPPSSSIASSGVKPSDDILAPPPAKKSRWDKKEKVEKDAAIMVKLEGRAFPVEIAYLEEASEDLVQSAVSAVYDIHLRQPPGDILIFLTGREEIDRCIQSLADNLHRLPHGAAELLPLALHSGLSTELQMAVFDPAPPRTRKVIVSTNVAEASVTIEGIKYVVDSGLVKNVLRFDWMTAPSSAMLERALEFLYCLGALDDDGKLTKPLGVRMAELPIDVMMGKILLDSHSFQCSDEILTIAAMTSVQNVFLLDDNDVKGELERRKFTAEEGDHLTYLNVYNAFVKHGRKAAKWCHNHKLNFKALSRALSIRTQLKKYLQRFDIPIVSCGEDHSKIRRCLTSGYFRNAAKLQPDGTYRSVREGTILHPHPTSVLFTRIPTKQFVIYHEVVETSKRFMRDITSIEQDWLPELAPHYYSYKEKQ